MPGTIEHRPNGIWIVSLVKDAYEYGQDTYLWEEERFGWGVSPQEAAYRAFVGWFMQPGEYARQLEHICQVMDARGSVWLR